ncbi:helix-turn-helix domain-containing protein [Brevundimonas bacteroides]|uniref:helix-turn-helix domain-containing protein n=1 Tax=Brevundimonas bacteroides TaxID=74311 RepID=UPI000495ED38|nr:helix-turn-helix domain-containing protein [Brevundimonas bacteroides]
MVDRRLRELEAQTLWIENIDQLSVGLAARRQDMVDRLLAFGPLSVKELAARLEAKPSALYHHLRMLLAAGLVVEAGSRVTNRKRVQLYAAPARAIRLRIRPGDPANGAAVQGFVRALARQIDGDFARGQDLPQAEAEGPGRNLALRRLCASPDAATLAEINRKLEEINALLIDGPTAPGGGIVLSWTLAPLPDPGGAED